LELGAGCGLVGITAGVLGAKEVVLTDLPYCLPLMQKNVDCYRVEAEKRGCQQMECSICDWFVPPELSEFGGADVILVADCVWLKELVQPLLATLEKLVAGGDVQVIISYQRRGKDTHEEFWNGLHALFDVVRETDTRVVGLGKPDCLYLLECSLTPG